MPGFLTRCVHFTVSSDIIDYIEPARTFGAQDLVKLDPNERFQRRIVAVPDRRGKTVVPMMFTMGNLGGFHLVRQDNKSSGGWERLDLHTAFIGKVSGTPQVSAFGVQWTDDEKQRITLAVAVDADETRSHSRIFVAYDLDSASVGSEIPWKDCGIREKNVRVDGMRVFLDQDEIWTVAMCGVDGPDKATYLLRDDGESDTFAKARMFSPAIGYKQVLSFEAGRVSASKSALHLLGFSGGGDRFLTSRPLPRFDAQGRIDRSYPGYEFKCPAGASVLDLGLLRPTGEDLYVGGDGVYRLPADQYIQQTKARFEEVMSPTEAKGIVDLVVGEGEDGAAAVWALQEDGALLVTTRGGLNLPWGNPLLVRKGIKDIAPIRGDDKVMTAVLLVYGDGSASYLWRDAQKEGVWQETPLRVSDPREASAVPCYGTTLRVIQNDGQARPNVKVKITASVLSSVVVNGKSVFVGPNLPAEVTTKFDGTISLFNRAETFTPATYRFKVDGLEKSFDVNPAAPLLARFQSMTAEELRGAKLPGSKQALLPDEFRTGAGRAKVDGMVAALNQAGKLAATTNGPDTTGIRFVNDNAPFSSRLRPDATPDGYSWGMQVGPDGVRMLQPGETAQLVNKAKQDTGFWEGLGDSIADFLEGAWQTVKDGFSYVVQKANDAYEFICSIGDRIKKFVLSTLEEIGSFFKQLWEEVKAGLQKVWGYVKFLFNWDDILKTRDILIAAIKSSKEPAKKSIREARDFVEKELDELLKKLNDTGAKMGLRAAAPPEPVKPEPKAGSVSDIMKSGQDTNDKASGNSVVSWITDNLSSLVDELVTIKLPESTAELPSPLTFVQEQWEVLKQTFDKFSNDIQIIFGGKAPSFTDLNADTIKRLAIALGLRVGEALLRVFKNLVVGLLEAVESFLDILYGVLFADIELPFIQKLIKLVSGSDVKVSFKLIEAIALLVAVPTTITFKLITGKSPSEFGANSTTPSAGFVSGQSSAATTGEGFIEAATAMAKDKCLRTIAVGYIGFFALVFDAGDALTPASGVGTTGIVSWFLFGLSATAVLLPYPVSSSRKSWGTWQSYGLSVMQLGFRGMRLWAARNPALATSGGNRQLYSAVDVTFYGARWFTEAIIFASGDSELDGLEFTLVLLNMTGPAGMSFSRAAPGTSTYLVPVSLGVGTVNLVLHMVQARKYNELEHRQPAKG